MATVERHPSIKGALSAQVLHAPRRQQTPPSLNTKGQDLTAYSGMALCPRRSLGEHWQRPALA